MRIVSLVPSLTDAVSHLGRGGSLVGVTEWCVSGAPEEASRIGGTKNPDVDAVLDLAPDLVLANSEENRAVDLDRLREADVEVVETHPRTVADAAALVRQLGDVLDVAGSAAPLAAEIESALAEEREAHRERLMALTPIWRKPWMAIGPGTYADDLLWQAGFGNVLSGADTEYPQLDPALVLGPDVVLLPSEPWAFSDDDLPAVGELVGADVPTRFVDGQALTWHGPRTAAALRTFRALRDELGAALPGA